MNDELVKRLRDYEESGLSPISPYEAGEAADAIEELQKAVYFHKYNSEFWEDKYNSLADEKWIPVTERLPEAGERVLCYCRANIYEVMKMRTDGDWVYDTNHIYMHSFVTHWMPLPTPPKEEQT